VSSIFSESKAPSSNYDIFFEVPSNPVKALSRANDFSTFFYHLNQIGNTWCEFINRILMILSF